MTATATSLAERLRARAPLLGTLVRMPNEALIEMTALVGMDFVVIDTEHGPGDQIPLSHHLMAAAAAGVPALVRICDPSEILRVLDLGAAGIIAPHISTAAEAEAIVRAAHYPPRGQRGFATYTRSGRHGLIGAEEHLRRVTTGTAVIVMIEDGAGVLAAQQIAAVDGVDGLFVGPADLAVSLGLPGLQADPQVVSAIEQVHAGARSAGKTVVSITGDPATAREHFAAGSDMVIYNVLSALGGLFTSLARGRADPTHAVDPVVRQVDPVVLLPGMLGGGATWEALTGAWDPALPVRAGRIDLDDSIPAMAASVLAAAPVRFVLIGHSLGGVVAQEVVRQAPARVSALILLHCSGRGPTQEQQAAWTDLAGRTSNGAFDDIVAEQARINLGPAAGNLEHVGKWQHIAHQVGRDGFLRQLAAQSGRQDHRPWLPTIGVPTLVIGGIDDEICTPELQRELADLIPGARYMAIQTGHMSMLENPPVLASLIADFLATPLG
ncbi:MAG: aldolase/citrate lyase family protein [Actinomycetota bacterium]|nr:aldolase/citrate lyase family protein [Actinomycetota bacterium]